jgi:KaiC/GvpD/RAD55 family RecA-like ATPase
MAVSTQLKHVKSYVESFDEILGGGIPHGSVVLVQGLPGTMKSTLVYSILYHNALKEGMQGLYITLEQNKKSIENQMSLMGFKVEEARARLQFLDVSAIQKGLERGGEGVWMDFLKRAIDFRRKMAPIDLIGIDSLEALEVLAKFKDRRTELFNFFEWLREQNATSFLIAESPPEAHIPGFLHEKGDDEDYLSDGIIHLKLHHVNDVDLQRRIRVVKMRAVNHKTGYFALLFEDGRFSVTKAMSGSF